MNLVTAHLTRLADFTGRENRRPFWLWVLIVYAVQMVLSTGAMIPMMIGMSRSMSALGQYDQAYLNAHPDAAMQVMTSAMLPLFRNLFLLVAASALVGVLLLAAAVVRRLHDTNRSGWVASPLVVLQLVTLAGYTVIFPRLFTALGSLGSLGPSPDPASMNAAFTSVMPFFYRFQLLGLVNFVYSVVLIVFLASRGTIGPNRYGDDLLPPPPVWQAPPQWQQPQWQPQQWQPPSPPPARIVGPWEQPPP